MIEAIEAALHFREDYGDASDEIKLKE